MACADATGDGLALVLYDGDAMPPTNRTVGGAAEALGYGGLTHALVREHGFWAKNH